MLNASVFYNHSCLIQSLIIVGSSVHGLFSKCMCCCCVVLPVVLIGRNKVKAFLGTTSNDLDESFYFEFCFPAFPFCLLLARRETHGHNFYTFNRYKKTNVKNDCARGQIHVGAIAENIIKLLCFLSRHSVWAANKFFWSF